MLENMSLLLFLDSPDYLPVVLCLWSQARPWGNHFAAYQRWWSSQFHHHLLIYRRSSCKVSAQIQVRALQRYYDKRNPTTTIIKGVYDWKPYDDCKTRSNLAHSSETLLTIFWCLAWSVCHGFECDLSLFLAFSARSFPLFFAFFHDQNCSTLALFWRACWLSLACVSPSILCTGLDLYHELLHWWCFALRHLALSREA